MFRRREIEGNVITMRRYFRRGIETEQYEADVRLRLPRGELFRWRVKVPVAGLANARRWAQQAEAEVLKLAGQGLDGKSVRTKLLGKEVETTKTETKEVPTLAKFYETFKARWLEAERKKPSAKSSIGYVFDKHIVPTLGALRLDEITEATVQDLKGALATKGLSAKTTNNVLIVLASMLRRAQEWGLIDVAPRVRRAKVQTSTARFYDFGEYARLVEAAAAIDPRVELLVLLGGDGGLRRGEIIALEWTDLDLERRTLHIQRSEWKGEVTAPKGGRSRRVPLTDALHAALKAHRHLKGPRVLCHEDGTGLNQNVLWRWMKQATRRAGLTETGHVHILRHTFCSHLAMRGATAKAIMELAGHGDLRQTSRYMHLSPAAKDAAINLLNQRPADESVEAGVEAQLQHPENVSESA